MTIGRTRVPCFDCNERQVGCHSKCNKYIEWQARNRERNNVVRESRTTYLIRGNVDRNKRRK